MIILCEICQKLARSFKMFWNRCIEDSAEGDINEETNNKHYGNELCYMRYTY